LPATRARDMRGQRNANPARSAAVFVLLLAFLAPLLMPAITRGQEVPELGINSTAYIVIDAVTGEVYAQRNADDQRAMASLTKVFTFIETINRAPLDQQILITNEDIFKDTSTRVGFSPGDIFSVQDLLYGMMLPSGNDASHALARGLGAQPGDASGDVGYERFIGWMNTRIDAMGLQNTQLVNPHGWGVPGHYSTAADLATFTRYAILFPEFLAITGTQSYTTANGYSFNNTNKLLSTYPLIIGGKTGYDDDAGYCLIEIAARDGSIMISVTLDGIAPDDWYDDNRVLLEYAFDTKAARQARGEAFSGDVLTYVDPGVTFLGDATARGDLFPAGAVATAMPTVDAPPTVAASPAASPGPPSAPTPSGGGEPPPDPDASETSSGPTVAPPGASVALVVAVAIALIFATLRGVDIVRRGHRRAISRAAARPPADGAIADPPPDSGDDVESVESVGGDRVVDTGAIPVQKRKFVKERPEAGDTADDSAPASEPAAPAASRRRGGLAARFAPRDLPPIAPMPDDDSGAESASPEPEYTRPASRRVLEPPPVLSPTSQTPIAEIPVPPAPPLAAFESPLLRDIVPTAPPPVVTDTDADAELLDALAVAEPEAPAEVDLATPTAPAAEQPGGDIFLPPDADTVDPVPAPAPMIDGAPVPNEPDLSADGPPGDAADTPAASDGAGVDPPGN
jgi:D-alanyl-D-alanine carboxypeptidase (penicillin-binding protein 5/6)